MKKNLGAVIKSCGYISAVGTLTVSSRVESSMIHQDATKAAPPPLLHVIPIYVHTASFEMSRVKLRICFVAS
jgi:hypothetical protein